MKILFISFEYPPYSGGIGEYTFQISSRLQRDHGCQVTVLTSSNHKAERVVSQFDASQVHQVLRFKEMPLRFTKLPYYLITSIYRFWKTVKTYINLKPDLIFACDKPSANLAYLLQKIWKINYVIMGHGSEFLQFSTLFATALHNADHVLLNSDLSKHYLTKNFSYPLHKCSVIPLGADEAIYQDCDPNLPKEVEKLRQKFDITKEKTVLLTVGTVSHRKGQDLVIQSLPQIISNTGKNITYIVAGRLRDNSLLKYVKHLGLEKNVVCTDFIERETLPALYHLSDIYIQPSRQSEKITELEGFSISTCEALMTDNAVIITKSMGIKDIIDHGNTGFIIDEDDGTTLTKIVSNLIQEPNKIKTIAAQGKAMADKDLTWKTTAEKTFSFLKQNYQN